MARQHADTAVISEGHNEVVNIRTAGAASKCSTANAIRICIRSNSSQDYLYSAEYFKTTIRYTPSSKQLPFQCSLYSKHCNRRLKKILQQVTFINTHTAPHSA